MRLAIIPLLGVLIFSREIFSVLAQFNPEAAILVSGLIASAIIGLIYLTPIAFVTARASNKRITRRTLLYVSILGVGLAFVGTVGHGTIGLLQNLTAVAVIETMLMTPMIVLRALFLFSEK